MWYPTVESDDPLGNCLPDSIHLRGVASPADANANVDVLELVPSDLSHGQDSRQEQDTDTRSEREQSIKKMQKEQASVQYT